MGKELLPFVWESNPYNDNYPEQQNMHPSFRLSLYSAAQISDDRSGYKAEVTTTNRFSARFNCVSV